LKTDKEIVLAAVANKGEVLKFAGDDLNQDRDCLKAAGMLDETGDDQKYKAILSLRFSLSKGSTPYASSQPWSLSPLAAQSREPHRTSTRLSSTLERTRLSSSLHLGEATASP